MSVDRKKGRAVILSRDLSETIISKGKENLIIFKASNRKKDRVLVELRFA